jgi:hypothetical protein
MPFEGQSSITVSFDQVTMHCKRLLLGITILRSKNIRTKSRFTDKYGDSTGNYTQTVLVNGQTISTLSTSDGYARGWG